MAIQPLPTPPGATCTVGPTAVTGERCGRPAVVSFRSTVNDRTFHECALHAPSSEPMRALDTILQMQEAPEITRPEDPGWEHEAMDWSPQAGEREIHAWNDIFHDRRRDAR